MGLEVTCEYQLLILSVLAQIQFGYFIATSDRVLLDMNIW